MSELKSPGTNKELEEKVTSLEQNQKAMLNILEDLSTERAKLKDYQKATINILEDFNIEKERAALANVELSNRTEELKVSNAELERFAYVASHDLQEPLRTVASFVQLLERRYGNKLDTDAREFIAYASDGANRMQVIIRDLLEYSRIGTVRQPFERFAAGKALKRALADLQFSIADSSAVITYDPLPEITADFSQSAKVFQNLVGNAIKFRRPDKVPQIHISAEKREDDWLFSVHDNGIGIDKEYFERIFVIFQRLQGYKKFDATGGTGIGLAICKRIVERRGGRIWPESEVGKGTTFYFTIPDEQLDAAKGS